MWTRLILLLLQPSKALNISKTQKNMTKNK